MHQGGKSAAVVRGPIASRVINQLVAGTLWGELDYLVRVGKGDEREGEGDCDCICYFTILLLYIIYVIYILYKIIICYEPIFLLCV